MSEMLEQVSRALAAKHYAERLALPVDDRSVVDLVNDHWRLFSATAYDAVKAMRSPTQRMLNMADRSQGPLGIWLDMIDEALK